jgi:hypothetical protein
MKNYQSFSILIILASFILTTHSAYSQEQSALEKIRQQQALQGGIFTGKVTDAKTGDDLIGANVFMVGTKLGASTDIEGKFQIKRVPEGSYEVRITFLGYEAKLISGVEIKTGETTVLNISLSEDQGIQQQEVVISASAIKSGEGAILAERKKASSIGDGISSEQMKKAPDATSGDALKRVTGVTLVDNKFVFVRGVTDRYNQTTLNGASVTSTSVDKKSFSFDMLPSNLIENMNVAKTATPDLPGDFTGGLVQLNTLDFPEARSVKLVLSGGINSITTFEPFNRSQGGDKDWIGADDGTRNIPNGVTPEKALLIGTQAKNTFAPRNVNAPMNQSMSVSLADVYHFEEDQFGYLAAISYRNNFQRTNTNLNDYSGTTFNRDLAGTNDRYSVLWGGILDLSLKFADLHKISLKNNYNKSAEDRYSLVRGKDLNNAQLVRSYLNEWEERGMLSNQLGGEHKFPEMMNMNIDWLVYFSQARTNQPDRKQVDYNLSDGYPDTDPYSINTQLTARSWAGLYERSLGQKLNASVPFGTAKVKFGLLNEQKNRHYDVRYFQPTMPTSSYELLQYEIDSVFAPQNFGTGKFGYQEITKPSDRYSAKQELLALYTMIDAPFSLMELDFRFSGGVRMEHSLQEVYTNKARTIYEPSTSVIDKRDFLPSVNLTYMITESQNFRLAYSHTVNRPEFREMANVFFYDFEKFEYVVGNDQLTRAYARNYDIRYEIFPDAGDLFAISYFYKSISAPIEERRVSGAGSATERSWINASHATNAGYEIEIRKHLGFIGDYFRFVQIVANYTRIKSEVPYREVSGQSGVVEGTRSMQGQSPYMYNISIFFTEPTLGTSMNILYNEYGSRIDAIGQIGNGDFNVVEHKRGTVDFSLTQPMTMLVNGLEAKYTVKNLNNQPVIFTHGDNEYRRNITGITHALQFSFNF